MTDTKSSELNFSAPFQINFPHDLPRVVLGFVLSFFLSFFASSGSAGQCENLYLGKKDIISQVPARMENGNDSPLSRVGLKDQEDRKGLRLGILLSTERGEPRTCFHPCSSRYPLNPACGWLRASRRAGTHHLCEGPGMWL